MSFLVLSLVTALSLTNIVPSVNGIGPNLDYPHSVDVDSSGNVYISETNNNRIVKFTLANPCPVGTSQVVYGTKVVIGVCFATEWSSKYPNGLAVDSSGNVYVAEYPRIFNIQKYTKNGNLILGWGSTGSNIGQFWFHDGVAVDQSGNVYVADGGNHRIQKFKLANPCPAGTTQVNTGVCFVIEWSKKGPLNGELSHPDDVAVDSSGDVYVAESGNNRIQKFKLANPCPTGTTQVVSGVCFVIAWSVQLAAGSSIALDSSGDVYVLRVTTSSIQKFKLANPCPAGTTQIKAGVCLVMAWGTVGSGNGEFRFPAGIAVDSSGYVFVADSFNYRIQKFKLANPCPTGTTQVPSNPVGGVCFVNSWGSQGPNRGQFAPNNVEVDSTGNVYVDDKSMGRIQKFTNTGMYLQTIPRIKEFPPQVTAIQSCIIEYPDSVSSGLLSVRTGYGPYGNHGNSFQFDPLTQDMAIFVAGDEVEYGSAVSFTAIVDVKWMPTNHDILVFVENKGDPLHNHQLDVGYEFYATTTFKDPRDYC